MKFMVFVFLSVITFELISIRLCLDDMRSKLDEVLTNASECGDVDCDDGYMRASALVMAGENNLYGQAQQHP